MKDFLFFTYSFVPTAMYLFKAIENCGYNCDLVTELDFDSFVCESKYRVVVGYLHEPNHIRVINELREGILKDSYFIQHDDTDNYCINYWFSKPPNLIMHRELFSYSRTPYPDVPAYPMHFPIPSIYKEEYQNKIYDVTFIGGHTNPRRVHFVNHLKSLMEGSLKHLNWYFKHEGYGDGKDYLVNKNDTFRVYNQSKIIIHNPGNSQDSVRIWEAVSAKAVLLSPQLPNLSLTKEFMDFDKYVVYKDDFSDLADKILWILNGDNWKRISDISVNEYLTRQAPYHCFVYYYNIIMHYCGLEKKPIKRMSARPIFMDIKWGHEFGYGADIE